MKLTLLVLGFDLAAQAQNSTGAETLDASAPDVERRAVPEGGNSHRFGPFLGGLPRRAPPKVLALAIAPMALAPPSSGAGIGRYPAQGPIDRMGQP